MSDINAYIRRSKRKTLAIEIDSEGKVIIRAPLSMPEDEIRKFVWEKREWIVRHVRKKQREIAQAAAGMYTEADLRRLHKETQERVTERAAFFASQLGVTYGKITVRRQKSRWGSCSTAGNLNFNCLLAECPPEVLDYVVVHELCHRLEMNHSTAFWAKVASVLPDYMNQRRWLKANGGALIGRLPQKES